MTTEKKSSQKMTVYEISEYSTWLQKHLAKEDVPEKEDFNNLKPVEYSEVLNGAIKKWLSNDSVLVGRLEHILEYLVQKGKLTASSWIKPYVSSIKLAERVSGDSKLTTRLVYDALDQYGQNSSQVQGFMKQLPGQSKLLCDVLEAYFNSVEKEEKTNKQFLHSWSHAAQFIVTRKLRDRRISGFDSEDADKILKIAADLLKMLKPENAPPAFVTILPAISVDASRSAVDLFMAFPQASQLLNTSFLKEPEAVKGADKKNNPLAGTTTERSSFIVEVLKESIKDIEKLSKLEIILDGVREENRKQAKINKGLKAKVSELKFHLERVNADKSGLENEIKECVTECAAKNEEIRKLHDEAKRTAHQIESNAKQGFETMRQNLTKIVGKEGDAVKLQLGNYFNDSTDKNKKKLETSVASLLRKMQSELNKHAR